MIEKYSLVDDIEFSINIDRTLNYMKYEKDYQKRHGFEWRMARCFHVAVTLYYSGFTTEVSIYIPLSKTVKKEKNRMIREIGRYKPSKEFVHMVRAVTMYTKYMWIRDVSYRPRAQS